MKQLSTGELEFDSFEDASLYFAKLLKEGTPIKSTNVKNLDMYKKEIVELRNVNYSIPMGKVLSENEFHKPTPFWAISESLSEILNLPRPIMERYKPDLMDWSYSITPDRMPCYSYGERLHNYNQIMNVFNRLKQNPSSKKGFLSIFQGYDSELTRPDTPCTLGWLLNIRDNKLDVTTLMRSWDFFAGQIYDAFLSNLIGQSFVSWLKNDGNEKLEQGRLHFFGGSLHYYPNKSGESLENMIEKGETNFYKDVNSFSINSNMENYFKDLHRLEDAEQASYNGNFSYASDKLSKISIPIFRDFARVYMIKNAKTYENAFLEKKYKNEIESDEMKKWLKQ